MDIYQQLRKHRGGGIQSGKTRAIQKTFRELAKGIPEKEKNEALLKLLEQAKKGNVRAFEVYRDTIGEKPVDKQLTANVEVDNLENLI